MKKLTCSGRIFHHFVKYFTLISMLLVLQGCVVFLSSVATVIYMKSSNHLTTTVLIKEDPQTVFLAMNKVLQDNPDIIVGNKDDNNLLIEASRRSNKVTAKATRFGSGITQLIVTADAGEKGQTDEGLALKVVDLVCKELGVEYEVVGDKN